MVSQDILLRTNQLTVGYREGKKEIAILEGVDLNLKSGELVCLMGPNGIGKSTLIRTLCGLQEPLKGDVYITNQPINEISDVDRSKLVSVVLTDKLQGGNLTVNELIEMGRYPYQNWLTRLHEDDHKAIERAINAIGLDDILQKKVHQLSDGQAQRAMIARALVQDGEVMILDEPTAHLDLNNRVEVMRLLRKLAHDFKKSILMATHELDLALQLADKLILVQPDGKIVEGIPEDLILNGRLDETFVLKGYNLKTGKAEFKPYRDRKVSLKAEGYYFLWAKNALERNGFEVLTQKNDKAIELMVSGQDGRILCILTRGKKDIQEFSSFEELLDYLRGQSDL